MISTSTQQPKRALDVFRMTLDAVADGVLVVGNDCHVIARNEQFIRMWRIPQDAAHSDDDRILLSAAAEQLDEPQAFLARVRELYDSSEEASFEILRFKDGRIFERHTRRFQSAALQPGRVWSFRDVTEERRLLSQATFLADASRLLVTLEVESALQAVVKSMVPIFAGACACDLLTADGTPRRIASTADQNTPPPDAVPAGALHSPQPSVGVWRGLEYARVPICSRGRVFGAFSLVCGVDRTMGKECMNVIQELATRCALAIENARLYAHAQQALRSREEFLSVVAHEIRGPLTSVRLATQALKRGGLSPDQTDRVLNMLQREDRRIAGFVDDLLELGRIQAGQFTIHLEPVNLSELAGEVTSRLTPSLTTSGSTIVLDLQPGIHGTWDRTRLDQVLTNLLTNAIKYGNRQPIQVEVSATGDEARVRVTDHGIGVPEDRLPHLFKPFERAVSSRQYGGLGLGLFIVKTIVEQLGGEVTVRSELGRGSTFEVTLPLTTQVH